MIGILRTKNIPLNIINPIITIKNNILGLMLISPKLYSIYSLIAFSNHHNPLYLPLIH